jgi:putative transposase
VIGLDVGEAETEAISDAHEGLKAAIAKALGCPWQRCTVHFLRDCLGHGRAD